MSPQEFSQPPFWPREPSEKELEAIQQLIGQKPSPDETYNLNEAASQLGISVDALRQRLIKLGHKMVPIGYLPSQPHHSLESIINAALHNDLINPENNE